MIYTILFYSLIALLLIIGILCVWTDNKGGQTSIYPINGVGLIVQKIKIPVKDEEGLFNVSRIYIGLLFIFVVFEWDEDGDEPEIQSYGNKH